MIVEMADSEALDKYKNGFLVFIYREIKVTAKMATTLRQALDAAATIHNREIMSIMRKHEKQINKAEWLWEKSHSMRKKWDISTRELILTDTLLNYASAMEESNRWAEESKKIRARADADKRAEMAEAEKKYDAVCSEAYKLYK